MVKSEIRAAATATAALASIISTPGTAIVAIPPIVVGPPAILTAGACRVSIARPDGAGPGAAIPFRALILGAPVKRTTTSFTTGGGGTSNNMVAAQRKAAGLPYEPQTVNPESAVPPATFAVDRSASMIWAPYQRLPLTPSKRVADPFALIFAQATSPSRGRIVSLVLSLARRPTAAPRVRITLDGAPDRGCRPQVIQVYAPTMPAAALARLSTPAANGCSWTNLPACTRAQWPRGRILFVSPQGGTTFGYRWIDYDLLAEWHFARVRAPGRIR